MDDLILFKGRPSGESIRVENFFTFPELLKEFVTDAEAEELARKFADSDVRLAFIVSERPFYDFLKVKLLQISTGKEFKTVVGGNSPDEEAVTFVSKFLLANGLGTALKIVGLKKRKNSTLMDSIVSQSYSYFLWRDRVEFSYSLPDGVIKVIIPPSGKASVEILPSEKDVAYYTLERDGDRFTGMLDAVVEVEGDESLTLVDFVGRRVLLSGKWVGFGLKREGDTLVLLPRGRTGERVVIEPLEGSLDSFHWRVIEKVSTLFYKWFGRRYSGEPRWPARR